VITGSRYRLTLVFMIIAVAILCISLWIAYVDINSDMFAVANMNNDKFGISELFPTANKGETWFFNSSHPIDGQFDPNKANITRNPDG